MNAFVTLDVGSLDTVTGGGTSGASSNIDSLLGTLQSLTSSIDEIKTKTSGLGQGEMLVLCMLAVQKRQTNVVYVAQPTRWW